MPKPLRILFVASEASPLVKTGGLADVAFALPRALQQQGHDVRVAIPCYATIAPVHQGERLGTCYVNIGTATQFGALRESKLPGTDVPLYLVEHGQHFGRDHPYGYNGGEYGDNLERFCFFSWAVLDGIGQIAWKPDVVHCNDWHTAAIPAYVRTRFADHPVWRAMPTVFTIHNLRYQGRYPASFLPKTGLPPGLFTPNCLEFYGDINLMKAGIAFAGKINTVSRTYAREIQTPAYGQGLDGFLRTRKADLSGIINGIDYAEWNPATDPHLPANYSVDDFSGKQCCKESVRQSLGLQESDAPLFCMVSRLVWDKGIDLVVAALDRIMSCGIQLMILGTGEARFEQAFSQAAARYPGRLVVAPAHDERMAHRFYAGADFFLMPSQTEPCGLSQMYSLAYGTAPIVRKTGGLADTIADATPANLLKGKATGIVFRPPTSEALVRAILRAMNLYEKHEVLRAIQVAGMKEDLSWQRASRAYLDLYRKAMAKP